MKNIAIVGATGAVGLEMLAVLKRRHFPVGNLRLFASERSTWQRLEFAGAQIQVEALTEGSFMGVDIALFSAGAEVSKSFVPAAVSAGCVVVDNSSAFRMDKRVPLVIPEINGEDVRFHKGVIANPNCTTAIMLMALYPLHRAFGVRCIFASSYQAVSGTGTKGMEELELQLREHHYAGIPRASVYPHQIALNVLPHVDAFLASGYTREEMKMEGESRKIMNHPHFRASMTCVRVPVLRAHSIAVSALFKRSISVVAAREVLAQAPGLDIVDDPQNNQYPLPIYQAGQDNCAVGRLRVDNVWGNRGLSFWVSGDQLLKGAALNAIQIAELLL